MLISSHLYYIGKSHCGKIIAERRDDTYQSIFTETLLSNNKSVNEGVQSLVDRSKLLESGILLGWVGTASEFKSMYVGQSEAKLSLLAQLAEAHRNMVTILIIDEIENLVQDRKKANSNGNNNSEQTSHLLGMLQGMNDVESLVIFGFTNHHDMIDDAFISRSSLVPCLRLSFTQRQKLLRAKEVSNYALLADIYLNCVYRDIQKNIQNLEYNLKQLQNKNKNSEETEFTTILKRSTRSGSPTDIVHSLIHFPVDKILKSLVAISVENSKLSNNFLSVLRTSPVTIFEPVPLERSYIVSLLTYKDKTDPTHMLNNYRAVIAIGKPAMFIWELAVLWKIDFFAWINFDSLKSTYNSNSSSSPSSASPQVRMNEILMEQFEEAKEYAFEGRSSFLLIDVDSFVGVFSDWTNTQSKSSAKFSDQIEDELSNLFENYKIKIDSGILHAIKNIIYSFNQKSEPSNNVNYMHGLRSSQASNIADVIKEKNKTQEESGFTDNFKLIHEDSFALLIRIMLATFEINANHKGKIYLFLDISNKDLSDRFSSNALRIIRSVETEVRGNSTQNSPQRSRNSPDVIERSHRVIVKNLDKKSFGSK